MDTRTKKSAFRIAFIYFIFSGIWIFTSDYIVSIFLNDIESFRYISTIKGTLFIIISATIIYYLVQHELKQINVMKKNVDSLREYDILTNLHNRTSFFDELESIENRNQQVSLIMSDVNGLKVINEVYTSTIGDQVLIEYSAILRKIFPDSSYIARIGGDEFCVIIYECSFEEAKVYSNRLKEEVSKHEIKDLTFGISLGLSSTCDTRHNVFDSIKLAEERMNKDKLLHRESSSNSLIASLKATLYEKSDETELHGSRLEEVSVKMGEVLGMSEVQINDIKLLAILHDIGKVGIDDSILKKPGPLTDFEYSRMKNHPVIGFNLANSIPQLEGIAYLILTHHERWDGMGYPNGLSGEAIPLHSRILAIVDAYDAMTNDRVYRQAMSKDKAIMEIEENRGTQFDPSLVDIFLQLI